MRNAGEKKETRQGAKWPKCGGHGGWREAAGREILWAYGRSFWIGKGREQGQSGAAQERKRAGEGEQGRAPYAHPWRAAARDRPERTGAGDEGADAEATMAGEGATTAALMGGMIRPMQLSSRSADA